MSTIITKVFQDKVKEDLKIKNLAEENLNNLGKQHYYLQFLTTKKCQLYKIELVREKKYKELYHEYRFNYDYDLKALEVDLYVRADTKYRKIQNIYKEIELEIEYLEHIVRAFQNRGFAIKNAVDIAKLEA